MKRTSWVSMLFLVVACGDKPMTTGIDLGETGEEVTSDGASETGAVSSASTPLTGGPDETGEVDDPGSSSGASEDPSCGFLCPEDMPPGGECDQWAQDCPAGQKCSAYADDGSTAWNNTKCVDVIGDPGLPGDACSVEGGGVSGIDSCDVGVMCWDVDPNTSQGVCVALCTGTAEAATCEAGFSCAIANDVLNLCLPDCDPLAQDCPGDDLCLPSDDHFICVLDAGGDEGQAFDPCEFGNVCDKGLYCFDPGYASECDANASGCCLPFCDLSAPDCPGVGQECQAWYDGGTAPPGFESVGFCGLPM